MRGPAPRPRAGTDLRHLGLVELRDRLDVEAVDLLLESVNDLLARLPHACKGAGLGIASSLEDAEEFPPRDDVEAAAQFGEELQDGEI